MARSEKHIELQNMVYRWIENRSFKMCGLTESYVVGYVADFVAIAGMHDEQHTKYTRFSGLKKKYMRTSFRESNGVRKVFGDIDRWYVCVFEVKVSRSDFLNTFGNKKTEHSQARMKPAGTAHWVVAEKGICTPDELPEHWGLLEPYGAGLTEKKMPKLNILQDSEIHAMAFDMLWLSMNKRDSYYKQLYEMAEAIGSVHTAILHEKPHGEILRRSKIAKAKCKGFI